MGAEQRPGKEAPSRRMDGRNGLAGLPGTDTRVQGTMEIVELFKQYLEHLFAGKRCEAREMIMAAQDRGVPARTLVMNVIWPAMEQIERLYREGQINRLQEHMATRINRMMADQLQACMARHPKCGKRMVVVCGEGEIEELGAQMTADLFEVDGWHVWFLGAGVPNDEILQLVGRLEPDVLCIYGAKPSSVPGIRKLIDLIREVGSAPNTQVLVTGGVFNRADGLAEEIRADLFAPNVRDAMKVVADHPVRIPQPDVPQPGRRRKRKARTVAVGAE